MSIENILFRKPTVNDLVGMLELMDEALDSPTLDQEMEERVQNWTVKLNDHSRYIFYVAEIESGKIIGWCRGGKTIPVHTTVNDEQYDCEIQNLFVSPSYHRRGIGGQLWQILWNDILLTFHPNNIVVWSVDKEQAQNFYLSMNGTRKEKRQFSDGDFHIAFVWHDLTPII